MFQERININKTETKRNRKMTTADYLEWPDVVYLLSQLKKDKDFSLMMVVALGSYLGLRYSDMICLQWADILGANTFVIEEKKTKKVKRLTINNELRSLCETAYSQRKSDHIISGKSGQPLTIQFINRQLKVIRLKYRIKIGAFSVHTFRKSFGRRVYENNYRSEHSLILLSDIFNHSSITITRRYLGLRQEEIANVYLNL